MPRIFSFRGKTIDDLQSMKIDDFVMLLNSRERRSFKRQGMDYKRLVAKADKIKKSGSEKIVRTRTREAVILPSWVGMKFGVHNGKEFKELLIAPEMLGHRLGEFVFPIKHVVHSAPGIRATRGSKFLAVK